MNKNDIRYAKTEESIEKAFYALLSKKRLDKITVTELAKEARIGKGTFYLHYLDVFDLNEKLLMRIYDETLEGVDYYEMFFSDPIAFFLRFGEHLGEKDQQVTLLSRDINQSDASEAFIQKLSEKLYATGKIERNETNDIRLEIVLSSLFYITRKYAVSIYHGAVVPNQVFNELISHYWG